MDLEYVKRVGVGAAIKAADVLRSKLGRLTEIEKKGEIDLVTEADKESEKIIIESILSRFPDHSILAEETGYNEGNVDCKWIIDPLDGTTNYAHQLGLFSVSIAFEYKGDVVAGIVLNPVTGELFSAVKGGGASLNGKPIHISNTESMEDSLLVTGFPYNFKEIIKPLLTRFENCLKASRGVRRLGSAALDLCYVACGRFDGFWEQNLKPWDTAAGVLIAVEAGATVTCFSDTPFSIYKNEILATNGRIHKEMIALLEI
ncbi:MAG: inositol monophosphatase [Desulfobacterales bacterium]|jgi:myo-inositol-1(or 4)-monophosphatase|nr:inositol monophosphatase [Desulfobacteraceae bacterium]MBT4363840.1 inositol monophosphatase [Desulfobacteraceae bacterium]MBT7085873.1 inositol monophosphatase [Desulfobacterales bacterium]MBT7697297.1 inositol monophosphatase [Desulfobacterales bacterium]